MDGGPVRAPIEKTGLEFVVNTNWDVFFDKSQSRYYLLADKTWLNATALAGPWTATTKLPPDMSKLPPNQNWDDVKKAVPPPATTAKAPQMFYSNTPAELISFTGAPVYSRISGTNLLYAKNTDSDVFLESGENQYYYLISGRWFRAMTWTAHGAMPETTCWPTSPGFHPLALLPMCWLQCPERKKPRMQCCWRKCRLRPL